MKCQTHTSQNPRQNSASPSPDNRMAQVLTLVRPAETTGTIADSTLPRRLDVHQIDAVATELRSLATHAGPAVVDASLVEMIDLPSLRSIAEVTAECNIQFVRPSVAFRATAEYTGTDLGLALPALAPLVEAA